MARKKRDEGLPIAVATQGGLIAALAVLLIGMIYGGRAWILLINAATAFMLTSAILKIVTAGVMQSVRWKATRPEKESDQEGDTEPAAREAVGAIRTESSIPESTETVAS
jgi:hypothetical protein